jgi:hypothetical protein
MNLFKLQVLPRWAAAPTTLLAVPGTHENTFFQTKKITCI